LFLGTPKFSREGGCAKHNLEKSDKILAIAPWIVAGASTVPHIQKLSG